MQKEAAITRMIDNRSPMSRLIHLTAVGMEPYTTNTAGSCYSPLKNGFRLLQVPETALNAMDDPKVGTDLNTAEQMSTDKVAALELAMREALWMLDVYLLHPSRAHAKFIELFKTKKHEYAIIWVLRKVRRLVASFLTGKFTPDVQFLEGEITFLSRPLACAAVAAARMPGAVIELYPWFWPKDPQALTSIHRMIHEPIVYAKDIAVDDSAAHTLIHELVHLVSSIWEQSFISMVVEDEVHQAASIRTQQPRHFPINDISVGHAITQQMKRKESLPSDEYSENMLRDWRDWLKVWEAYGPWNCRTLASLNRGAQLAVRNADSFAVLVTHVAYNYLVHQVNRCAKPEPALALANDEMARLVKIHAKALSRAFICSHQSGSYVRSRQLGPSAVGVISRVWLSEESRNVFSAKRDEVQKILAVPPWREPSDFWADTWIQPRRRRDRSQSLQPKKLKHWVVPKNQRVFGHEMRQSSEVQSLSGQKRKRPDSTPPSPVRRKLPFREKNDKQGKVN